MSPDEARALALAFDGAAERDHHGFPSFRTTRRIFATLPDDGQLRVMLPEEEIRAAVAEWPWCEEQWWGKRLSAVRVVLADCEPAVVAERYRRLAATLTERVASVPDGAWSRPSPCEGWTARDLVGHLIDVHGRFLGLVGRELVDHPSVADDPLAAWSAVRDQVQADLDDPVRAAEEYDGRFGRSSFAAAVDGFVCFDLVVHGWDLARATGQDELVDPDEVERIGAMVTAMQPTMLENGVIRDPVDPPPGASPQDSLLCALGRRP